MRPFRPPSSTEVRALLGLSALLLALATGVAVGANIGSAPTRANAPTPPASLGTAVPFHMASGARFAVAAVQVVDPITPAPGEDGAQSGNRFVGVNFLVVNTGSARAAFALGQSAVLIDDFGQAFSSPGAPAQFVNCPHSNSIIALPPASRIGVCVPFEMPDGAVADRIVIGNGATTTASWLLLPTPSYGG